MKLLDWLAEQKMSQTELESITGIDQALLSKYARGSRRPGHVNLLKIEEATRGAVGPADWPPAIFRKQEDHWQMPGVPRKTFVYFVKDTGSGFIKIGRTQDDPYKRVAMGQTFNPSHLLLLGFFEAGRSVETQLHVEFARDRVSGEWYRDTPVLRGVILARCPNAQIAEEAQRLYLSVESSYAVLTRISADVVHVLEVKQMNGVPPEVLAEQYQIKYCAPVTLVKDEGHGHEPGTAPS